jgi:hypothetical protein
MNVKLKPPTALTLAARLQSKPCSTALRRVCEFYRLQRLRRQLQETTGKDAIN